MRFSKTHQSKTHNVIQHWYDAGQVFHIVCLQYQLFQKYNLATSTKIWNVNNSLSIVSVVFLWRNSSILGGYGEDDQSWYWVHSTTHARLPRWLSGKESACVSSIPVSRRSPGEGGSNPLHYSCLNNPTDWGAWWLQSMGSPSVGHDWAHTLEMPHSLSCSARI